jgi:hypothetical protein
MKSRWIWVGGMAAITAAALAGTMIGQNQDVTICHIPPGNPAGAETIVVPQSAVAGHLAHGDTLGPCPTSPSR